MLTRLTLALLTLVLLASAGLGQATERDMKKEEAIWNELKSVAPKEIDHFKAATIAMDSGKYDEAVRLYEAVVIKAPEFDPAIRRLGISTALAGKVEEGLRLLEHALSKNRSPENLLSLAQVLAYPSENVQGTRAQKEQALKLMSEAINKPGVGNDAAYPTLLAQLALDLDRIDPLRVATRKLVAEHQELMITHYFNDRRRH